ncbi:NADP-dependent oxidoreductase [Nocardia takedensis]|uniref:NADP-dependent oxidoreductase n=1 Tax=Nocardia takedensis TaxID=259390 RepID=UPI00030709F1|nr:NADP-dependent oxidoreductase [Nocardia takedensis]
MRAIEYDTFGGPEVLRLNDRPVPEPGEGQVRVAVKVAAVNGVDWKIRRGDMGDQSMPQRPGLELSGVVDAVGPGATVAIGDEVFGWSAPSTTRVRGWEGGFPGGAYADYSLADVVARKPPALSWTEAAILPVAGETALRGVRRLGIRTGDVVLVQGGSGVVGSVAVQLAVARGATVIATASADNAEYVSSLGATAVRYGEGLVDRVRQLTPRIDAALDAAGYGGLENLIVLCAGTDRVLSLADPGAVELGIPFDPGAPQEHTADVLSELASMAVEGTLRVRHARSFPLSEAAVAQELSATGHVGGKITLNVC